MSQWGLQINMSLPYKNLAELVNSLIAWPEACQISIENSYQRRVGMVHGHHCMGVIVGQQLPIDVRQINWKTHRTAPQQHYQVALNGKGWPTVPEMN